MALGQSSRCASRLIQRLRSGTKRKTRNNTKKSAKSEKNPQRRRGAPACPAASEAKRKVRKFRPERNLSSAAAPRNTSHRPDAREQDASHVCTRSSLSPELSKVEKTDNTVERPHHHSHQGGSARSEGDRRDARGTEEQK